MPLHLTNAAGHAPFAHYPGNFPPLNVMGYPGMGFMGAGQMEFSHLNYPGFTAPQTANLGHLGYDAAGNFGALPSMHHHMAQATASVPHPFLEAYAAASAANGQSQSNDTDAGKK
jgi:hypothetical protein